MRKVLLIACLAALAPLVPARAADPPPTAADSTERGRELERILDQVLAPAAGEENEDRALALLLDPTQSLTQAGFADRLAESLSRNSARLSRTRIGVFRTGEELPPAFAAGTDGAAVAAAARAVIEKPVKDIQNVYYDVRRTAGVLAGQPGRHELVLVTLENGDAVDDVEATISALKRAGVRLSVVAREAFLSDSFWLSRGTRPVRDLDLMPGEAAFLEVPWGFLYQQDDPTQVVSSGFAMYGLSRIAGGSGGKVFLYYPPTASGHQCSVHGGCIFCSNDHASRADGYEAHRLRALAPLSVPVSEALGVAGRDPYYRAVLKVWDRAAKDGLLRSRPSVRGAGGGLRIEKRPVGSTAALGTGLSFSSIASKAEDLARSADAVAREFEAELAAIPKDSGGLDRYRAVAELTLVLIRITRVNLLLLAGFCREAGPTLVARETGPPPEVPCFGGDQAFVGIAYSTMSLCHGVRPFREVKLPGGEAVKKEIVALEPLVEGFLDRYDHTPFGTAIRRSGLARFSFSVRGKYIPPDERQIPNSNKDDVPTEKDRPDRGGGGSSGSGGTATSGG